MGAGDDFLQGIDCSKWQATTPDLTGAYYLIARAGIGTKPDPTYNMHIAAAKKAGLVTGSYWFNWGSLSVADQVAAYIAIEGDVDLHVIDWEGADGFTAAQTADFIKRYRAATGNKIALYASESRFRDLGQDWNWIANYSQEPRKAYDMWQYGPFHGADGNRFRGTLDDLHALAGTKTMTPAPITDQTPKEVRIPAGASIFDVDGKTILRTSDGSPNWRPSPYAQGGKRAIFSPDPPIVLIAVGPADIREVTATTSQPAYPDLSATVAEQAALIAEQKTAIAEAIIKVSKFDALKAAVKALLA